MDYEIEFYLEPDGTSPIDDFLDGLQEKPRAKIMKFMELLGEKGPNLPRPYADIVRGKIRELRVSLGTNEYRVLYFFDGKTIVMADAFVKKTEKVPENAIDRAERRSEAWLAGRRA